MQHYTYKTKGTCSKQIDFDIEDNKIHNLKFLGGCPGNTLGICQLLEGADIEKTIQTLSGVKCGFKSTSCPDQLAQALKSVKK